GSSGGRWDVSQGRQKAWRADWSGARDRRGTARASRSLTECAECGLEPEWGGWEAECARVRNEREAVWGTLRLYGRLLLGIFWHVARGQTRRKAGTQSHRSKAESHDSGVAGKAQVLSKRMSWRPDGPRARVSEVGRHPVSWCIGRHENGYQGWLE